MEKKQDLIEDTFRATTVLLPESKATMVVQCACKRTLSDHALVHGAGFLNIDVMSLYGVGNGQGYMDCATKQVGSIARA